MTLVDSRAQTLRQAYPGWTLRQSFAGRWWAHRTVSLPTVAFKAGCRMTLDADDLDGLARLLGEQARKSALVSTQ